MTSARSARDTVSVRASVAEKLKDKTLRLEDRLVDISF